MEKGAEIKARFDILPEHVEYLRPLMAEIGYDIDVLIQGDLNDFFDALDDLMSYHLTDDDAAYEPPYSTLEDIKNWMYGHQTRWKVTYHN